MLFCGVPIFLQEVAIGQYLGAGGMTMIAKICPILKGNSIDKYIPGIRSELNYDLNWNIEKANDTVSHIF